MLPPFSSLLARDRRVWLLVLCSLLAFMLGFVCLKGMTAIGFLARSGYWFMLSAFLLFLYAFWRNWANSLKNQDWKKVDRVSALLVLVCGTILLVHETPGFKIVMDEIMLLGTSMSMHFDRAAVTPLRGNDIQGAFVLMDGIVDKRPLFFPFLLSLVHDLSGYRPSNSFLLNGLLSYCFLWLANLTGRQLAGREGGWLAVLLFTGLPLLAHNALGGGFELLNLTLVAATFLAALRFAKLKEENSLSLFALVGVLLCNTRYESVLIVAPLALLVPWVWWRERRVMLPWPVLAVPLLLIPVALQMQVFESRGSAWELESMPGFTTPFSLAYIPDNLSHAAAFFFGKPSDQPSSFLFSLLGWLAVPFAVLQGVKILRKPGDASPVHAVTVLMLLGLAAHFVLMMAYFYGRFDMVVIRRLSLPTHFLLLLSLLLVLPVLVRSVLVHRLFVAVGALGVLALGIPAMAIHAYSQEYLPGRETQWRRHFMAEQHRPDYLVIDNDSALWVSHRISATPISRARERLEALEYHMRNRSYSSIYVFQRLEVDPETGATRLREGDDLGPAFVLEPVREERLQMLRISRISRLVELRREGVSIRPEKEPDGPRAPEDPEEQAKARVAYIQNFLKNLP